jgi:hypothetical protein
VEEVGFAPSNAGVLVGLGVREAVNLARLTANEAVESGALLVDTGLDSVALSALGLEELGAYEKENMVCPSPQVGRSGMCKDRELALKRKTEKSAGIKR